jgi:hypothetical protein
MDAISQVYAQAILSTRPCTLNRGGLCGPQGRYRRGGEEKNTGPWPDSNPGYPKNTIAYVKYNFIFLYFCFALFKWLVVTVCTTCFNTQNIFILYLWVSY